MTGRRTTHYRQGGRPACAERIQARWLSADPELTSCGNCARTRAWQAAALVRRGCSPADAELLAEWIERLAG